MNSSRSAYIALEMNGSRILVAEDDGRLAATLDRLLTAEGHHIEVVGDGLQALRLVREQPFDPVEAREHDVEHDEVERLLANQPERLQAVSDHLDMVALGGQQAIEGRGKAAVVLRDENPGTVHFKSYISAA